MVYTKIIIGIILFILLFLLYVFRYNLRENIVFAPEYCLQRLFGYNDFYDKVADIIMNLKDRKIYYNYKGKEWRIELWKGRYCCVIGAEAGIYHRNPKSRFKHYNSAFGKDLIHMEMELLLEDKLLLKRKYDRYWWINGFRFDILRKIPIEKLKLKLSINFNDFEERSAFVQSYIKAYDNTTIEYSDNENCNLVKILF